ncbi:MAG TPA: glycine cleavage T C-terminal barrel domain-containing protein [Candidatus Krumholzibacteria bacterium]|nr:glycine cleavage T C-terminal barrel domain-containing protein [Candidatus Krumholzibacteria bacterium]
MERPSVQVQAEYDSLRQGAGLIDLSACGKLRLGGSARARFLNSLLTHDILALAPGSGCNALKVTLQGKMEAALRVLCLDDELWCDFDAAALEGLLRTMRMRVLRDDVKIEDASVEWSLFSIQGPLARGVFSRLDVDVENLGDMHRNARRVVAGSEARIVRSDHTGEGGWDVCVLREAGEAVRSVLLAAGAVAVGTEAHDIRRVEAGIPWHGFEITPDRLPHEAGLDAGWISYTKGCFFGQETIARLHHLGHVNRNLRRVVFDGHTQLENLRSVLRQPILFEGKEIGTMTSVAFSLALDCAQGLAYIRRGFDNPESVHVQIGSAPFQVRIAPVPSA